VSASALTTPRTAWSAWLPVVAWAAVIFAFSSIPSLSSGLGGWDLLLRKLAHVTEYAILGALLLRATRRPVLAVGLAALYAVSDEVHQHFVEGRHAAVLDVLIDTAGAVAGVLAWRWLGGRRKPAHRSP
jgi:VanZ family protein